VNLRALLVVALAVVAASACAKSTSAARPTPFPGRTAEVRPVEAPRIPPLGVNVVREAVALAGTPYRLGGDNPSTGFDCSGLVRYVYAATNVSLPRTVAEQFHFGVSVPERDVRPGDLLFFTTSTPGPSHVGIAIDQTRFVHAPGTGSTVRVERFDT